MGGDTDGGGEETDGAPPAAVRAGCGQALSASLACRSLLTGAIDYAGLFPPASLSMADAVAEYKRHREAPDDWALGRFVVPLSRWNEFDACVFDACVREVPSHAAPWPVSLIVAPGNSARIRDVMKDESRLVVEAVECKVETAAEAKVAGELGRVGVEVFVEPSKTADFASIAAGLARSGSAAKIRTGGVTADAFPTTRQVLDFLHTCRRAGIRFKATAGLHHAVRGEYRLTYEPSPPHGLMFGFLNIAMAAAFLWFGRDDDILIDVLEERSIDAFEFTDDGASWRNEQLTQAQLESVRAAFFAGFGSCSFREPMAELGLEALPRL